MISTYETALPVYQDSFQALALHILQVDLNLPEHEVVRLRISVADCQQLLQAGCVQLLCLNVRCDKKILSRIKLP